MQPEELLELGTSLCHCELCVSAELGLVLLLEHLGLCRTSEVLLSSSHFNTD